MAKRQPNPTEQLDAIVLRTIQGGQKVQKSVVVAPGDPTGAAKLPRKQEGAAKRKVNGKTQYPAIFDREASESDEQLDEWLDDTQEVTESPDDFVEDAREDDAPEDSDDEQFDDNHGDIYDPYGDDDEMGADNLDALDLPDDENEYVKVRGHKRRKTVRKSNAAARGDMDEDFAGMSDDDDLDEGDEDDDDEKDEKKEKAAQRRKEVRKALGADAVKFVDGNEFIKSLTDAVWDMKDQLTLEVRSLRMENRKLQRQLAVHVKNQNTALAKSLTKGQMMIAGYEVAEEVAAQPQQPARQSQPVRKGFGAEVRTTRPSNGSPLTDISKAMDVLEEAFEKSLKTSNENPELLNAVTMLENDGVGAVQYLPVSAQEVLQKAGLLR